MTDSTQVSTSRAITVPFHGADLYVVEHNGQPYTPMRPIVEGMGLTWPSQFRKLSANKDRWGIAVMETPMQGVSESETPSGGVQKMLAMPLRKLPGWLANIESGKVKSAKARAAVIQYQNECDDVLWQYWNDGAAINPRAVYSVNPVDKLTGDEAESLRLMLKTAADRQPKARQAALMVQGWSKLKAHFKVGYREIPRHEFSEAVSIIARHAADWEVGDEAPMTATLNQTVADWVQKIEEKNGYPALIFLPLVEAVQRKLGGFSKPAALPRLRLQVSPPARGTYKFNSANPYPRDGRTIEVAKSIITDIRNWSDKLPACPARDDLHDAAQTLHDLLVSGWTEVDEALSNLSTAMHYLNRWQGRGGGVGNVRSVSPARVTR